MEPHWWRLPPVPKNCGDAVCEVVGLDTAAEHDGVAFNSQLQQLWVWLHPLAAGSEHGRGLLAAHH